MKFHVIRCLLLLLILAMPYSIVAQENAKDKTSDAKKTTEAKEASKKEDPYPHLLQTMKGDKVYGKMLVEKVDIETKYGKLSVPLKEVVSVIPGLRNHQEFVKKIHAWVEQLSESNFKKRENAQKELLTQGPRIREILEKHLKKANAEEFDAELKTRLKSIIEEFDEREEDEEDEEDEEEGSSTKKTKLIQEDQVFTTSFVIKGKVLTDTYKFKTKYGEMTFKLKDIKNMLLKKPTETQAIMKSVTVEGDNFHSKNIKNTGIYVRRGDVINLTAKGEIILTPWSDSYRSTPDGHPRAGMLSGTKFKHGALVAQVGDGVLEFVGTKKRLVARSTGKLKLGMVMHSSYTRGNYDFPGSYQVKIKVESASSE